jgi:hypothetical protein
MDKPGAMAEVIYVIGWFILMMVICDQIGDNINNKIE